MAAIGDPLLAVEEGRGVGGAPTAGGMAAKVEMDTYI
jgi:hypothetical protein